MKIISSTGSKRCHIISHYLSGHSQDRLWQSKRPSESLKSFLCQGSSKKSGLCLNEPIWENSRGDLHRVTCDQLMGGGGGGLTLNRCKNEKKRVCGDKGRRLCWCAENKNMCSPQQNEYITSCLSLHQPWPERCREFCVVRNASEQRAYCCTVLVWKCNSKESLDQIVRTSSGVLVSKRLWYVICDTNTNTNMHKWHLTSSLLSTVLHSHLLPQWVDGYEVDGTHTRVDTFVSAHVNQPTGFLACRQNCLPWKT